MSQLTIYSQFNMRKPYLEVADLNDVARHLAEAGVRYEHRPISKPVEGLDSQALEELLAAEIAATRQEFDYRQSDCVVIKPEDCRLISIRDQYLSEHTHAEDEVRWFIDGKALYYIHVDARIHILECGAGDFIAIPQGFKHWFDMGPEPLYSCVRWFNSKQGLQTRATGSYVAESTPRWESMIRSDTAALK